MGTAQMVRNDSKTVSWSSIFPPEQVSEQQSALFVKKLLAVAVSSVTYLRAIFPEHAFGDRRLEDLNLKILKDDSACPGACQVIQWIKGCFDALDKRYLRMIVIGVYTDADDPDTVIESYTFKFTYSKEGMSIYRNGSKIASAYTEAETKKATIRLLRTIIILTQTLTSLPDDVMMSMRLLYYDKVTPLSYQPPGFMESGVDCYQFADEPMNIKVGDVSTPFHTVKLRIKTELHQFELKEDDDETEMNMEAPVDASSNDEKKSDEIDGAMDEHPPLVLDSAVCVIREDDGKHEGAFRKVVAVEDHAPPTTPLEELAQGIKRQYDSDSQQIVPSDSMELDQVPSEIPHTPGTRDSAGGINTRSSTPLSCESREIIKTEDDDAKVKCSCGYNEDDGLMIMCGECKFWEHAVCYGILEEHQAPELHICATCSKKVEGLQCTDECLTALNQVALQATCLWRRALLACSEMSRILPTTLSRRLGIEMTVALGLINKLEKEGFVRSAIKGKRLGKIVNKAKLNVNQLRESISHVEPAEKHSSIIESQRRGSQYNTTAQNIESITVKASKLDVSGKQRVKKNKDNPREQCVINTSHKRTSRGGKRAISAIDKSQEFEICDSQEPAQDTAAPARKRKSSISTKPIMV